MIFKENTLTIREYYCTRRSRRRQIVVPEPSKQLNNFARRRSEIHCFRIISDRIKVLTGLAAPMLRLTEVIIPTLHNCLLDL